MKPPPSVYSQAGGRALWVGHRRKDVLRHADECHSRHK